MTELSWSRSTTSSNSGSVMLAASISSCVISGISSETPVRTTCATPVGLSGSAGNRRRSSCAHSTFAGSTCANAMSGSDPSDSRTSTAHQSARSGTASRATRWMVASQFSERLSSWVAPTRKVCACCRARALGDVDEDVDDMTDITALIEEWCRPDERPPVSPPERLRNRSTASNSRSPVNARRPGSSWTGRDDLPHPGLETSQDLFGGGPLHLLAGGESRHPGRRIVGVHEDPVVSWMVIPSALLLVMISRTSHPGAPQPSPVSAISAPTSLMTSFKTYK